MDQPKNPALIFAVLVIGTLTWSTLGLLLVEPLARRLVSLLLSTEVSHDRAFDRFYWVTAAGGARGSVAALCQLLFFATWLLGPPLLGLRLLTQAKLLPDDVGSRLFLVGLPLYMAWLCLFFVSLDPLARRLLGVALGTTIGKRVWVSTFNWEGAATASAATRVTVRLADFIVTALGYLTPIALGVLQLVRALAKK